MTLVEKGVPVEFNIGINLINGVAIGLEFPDKSVFSEGKDDDITFCFVLDILILRFICVFSK